MQTTDDPLTKIEESVSRLDVPPPFLYRQVHQQNRQAVDAEKSDLIQARERARKRALDAALIVMRNGGYQPEAKQKTYLKRIRGH